MGALGVRIDAGIKAGDAYKDTYIGTNTYCSA